MGQYYLIVNLDLREYLDPAKFGDGRKLMEFGVNGCGTMAGLAILLADGNGRGYGDLKSNNSIIGLWAGNRVVITGDYANEGNFTGDLTVNLYDYTKTFYRDVSEEVIMAMCEDKELGEELQNTPYYEESL